MKNFKKNANVLFTTLIIISASLLFNFCSKKDDSGVTPNKNKIPGDTTLQNTTTVSDNLHFAFKTPDWERNIDCTLLDLYPDIVNDSTNHVSATSESTKETFFFTYPIDSSEMMNPGNLKKYKIMKVYENNQAFQFSQKMPKDANSPDTYAARIISSEGFSDTEYNQVVEKKYLESEAKYVVFRVKCKYEMKMYWTSTPDVMIPVTGTFTFKIRTKRQ